MTLPPYPPYSRPDDDACERAAKYITEAGWCLSGMGIYEKKDPAWDKAFGYLQDGLAELGLDLVPLKSAPPRTPEAIYDDAAYARGRGGV
jgi:hypothetical protein